MKVPPAAPLPAPSFPASPEVAHSGGPETCGETLVPVGGGALVDGVAVTVAVTVVGAAAEPPPEPHAASSTPPHANTAAAAAARAAAAGDVIGLLRERGGRIGLALRTNAHYDAAARPAVGHTRGAA